MQCMKSSQSEIRAKTTGTTIRIYATMDWRAERSEEDGGWVGVCKQLGITTEAETLDELHSLAPEAMEFLFLDLLEDGELEEFLKQKGWKYSREGVDTPGPKFHIPWQLLAAGGNTKSSVA